MYPFYETLNREKPDYFSSFVSNNMTFPPHLHSSVEMIYVLSGELVVTINEKRKLMQAGDFGISFPNEIHSYHTETESEIMLIIFSPEIVSGYFNRKSNKAPTTPFLNSSSIEITVTTLIKLLLEEHKKEDNRLVIKGYLYSILGKLDKCFEFRQVKYYNYAIQSLLSYIAAHYKEQLTLDNVAVNVGFSKFYISRLFNNKIGYSFTNYVSRLRINMAEELLLESEMAIVNIALECGFDSYRNFNRVFKEFIGVTPSEYRSKLKT